MTGRKEVSYDIGADENMAYKDIGGPDGLRAAASSDRLGGPENRLSMRGRHSCPKDVLQHRSRDRTVKDVFSTTKTTYYGWKLPSVLAQ